MQRFRRETLFLTNHRKTSILGLTAQSFLKSGSIWSR